MVGRNTLLRPLERRLVDLSAEGRTDEELSVQFRRSPAAIRRILELTEVPRAGARPAGDVLRPLERRVLRWRAAGAEPADIAVRFRRTPRFVEQVERLAHYKLTVA